GSRFDERHLPRARQGQQTRTRPRRSTDPHREDRHRATQMIIGIRFAARSDVGLLREGNEDSAYAGSRLLAVADGMGGHVGGEIASSLTIASMAKLDSEPPGGDMLAELAAAVAAANTRLQEMIIANPAVEGMGTTLTALFWSDGHAAVCHIGDSRGYLLRDGELY